MATVRYPKEGAGIEVEVPVGTTLLEASVKAHVPHGSACGGVCACSTCHVYVLKGRELVSEQEDDEADILDKAFDVRATSRLGCQARIEKDGVIEIVLSSESVDTWWNEHPKERHERDARLAAQKAAAGKK